MDKKYLTNESGAPVSDNTNSLTAGPRGPILLEDNWLIEKLAHFDREVIPERRMHAKGSGAFGTFTVTNDVTRYTSAALFSQVGKKSDILVRFSTVAGERGAADAERDIRGFAVRFYTEEGNWDLVGNNTPVFFLRDPLQFPDLNHAIKRDPKTNLRSPQSNWDFWTMLPEALHQVTIVMSDRGIPATYRNMHGFGSHTFSLINAQGVRVWVKFHFVTQQGIKNLSNDEAAEIIAKDRESHGRDLFNAIATGDYPRWKLCFQIMTEEQARDYKENPFDLTKVWSHKEFPLIEAGVIELNRNPDNYFAQIEQAAFNPAHIVPGIGFSPDKMLQGRLFSYGDAQRYRLGVNHDQIPVNRPRCPMHSFHRDGLMRVDDNNGATKGYSPNSIDEWQVKKYHNAYSPIAGDECRYDYHNDCTDDCFYQPGNLYRLLTEDKRKLLINNTAEDIMPVTENIKYRHAAHCYLADAEYGTRIAEALHLSMVEVKRLASLGIKERLEATRTI
ncbi:MAG: catalase [Bacteroidaceae bacterium]|nr:catalase [Bacteroidaceae bacterium]